MNPLIHDKNEKISPNFGPKIWLINNRNQEIQRLPLKNPEQQFMPKKEIIKQEKNNIIFTDSLYAEKLQIEEYSKNIQLQDTEYIENNFPKIIPKEEEKERGFTISEICQILDKKNTPISELNENLQCNICFAKYDQKRNFKKLICGHWYDYQCISKWMKDHSKCPYCKMNLGVDQT